MEELLGKIKSKRLVLLVTTGRSGTKYLSFLFGLLNNFRSEHEASPGFHDFYRAIQNGKYTFREFWLKKKLPHIAEVLEEYYSDTSHVACKGFFESLIELGIKPYFIILKRNNRDVARSLFQLNTIPGRTDLGLKYLSSPDDPGVLRLNRDWRELSDYQLCYWYTLEIDRRIGYYKGYFKQEHCDFTEVTFDDLMYGDGFMSIVKNLKLPSISLTNRMRMLKWRSTVMNGKQNSKFYNELINYDLEESKLLSFTE